MSNLDNTGFIAALRRSRGESTTTRTTMTADTRMVSPRQPFTPDPRPPRSCPCELRPGWRWDGLDRLFKHDDVPGILAELTEEQYRAEVLEELYPPNSPAAAVALTTVGGITTGPDDPDPHTGNVGDFHLSVRTGYLWHKTGPVTWERGTNISPSGSNGITLVSGGSVAGIGGSGGGGGGGPGNIIWGAGGGGGGGAGGFSGIAEWDGRAGVQGIQGVTGQQGIIGPQGIQGQVGPNGMSFAGAERLNPYRNEQRAVIPNPGESMDEAVARRENEEAAERALRSRVDRGRIERIAIENNDGNSLRQLMTSGRWLHTMLWRWQTYRRMQKFFPPDSRARIKSDASICWKGRSGTVLWSSDHPGMQDMVVFRLDSGVVGTRDWTTNVSIYDLEPMTFEEHTTEMQAWYVRITSEEDRLEAERRGIAQEKAKAERVRQERIEKPIVVEPVKHGARRRLIVD